MVAPVGPGPDHRILLHALHHFISFKLSSFQLYYFLCFSSLWSIGNVRYERNHTYWRVTTESGIHWRLKNINARNPFLFVFTRFSFKCARCSMLDAPDVRRVVYVSFCERTNEINTSKYLLLLHICAYFLWRVLCNDRTVSTIHPLAACCCFFFQCPGPHTWDHGLGADSVHSQRNILYWCIIIFGDVSLWIGYMA